jgi:Uncharacterized conserved protein
MDLQTNGVYLTDDGSHSIISEQFNESYHSRHGALKESIHVFINAGLKAFTSKSEISILEVGLGTGLNAWLTNIETRKQDKVIMYTGLEPYPIAIEIAESLNYPNVLFEEDIEIYKKCFLKLHEIEWDETEIFDENFHFTKIKTTLADFSPDNKFDIVYFDAFAPNAQPELWTEEVFQKLFDLMAPGGIMVTYCAKGIVKRSLKAIGFTVETLEGPPGKREMTRAVKPA